MTNQYIITRQYNDDIKVNGLKAAKKELLSHTDAIRAQQYGSRIAYKIHNNKIIRVLA
jgi:hypothetical protein